MASKTIELKASIDSAFTIRQTPRLGPCGRFGADLRQHRRSGRCPDRL